MDGSSGTGIQVLSSACKTGRDVFRRYVTALCGYALDGKALLLFVRYQGIAQAKLSPFQKKFYAKLYRLRIVEQKRFEVGGAKYTEDLKRFHQLQDEYLLLVNNDIKSVVELVDFISEQKERFSRLRTDSMRYTEKTLAGNAVLRTKSSTGNIRYGMWECRKNWTN